MHAGAAHILRCSFYAENEVIGKVAGNAQELLFMHKSSEAVAARWPMKCVLRDDKVMCVGGLPEGLNVGSDRVTVP